ncbi:collagen-like protein [Croceivirga lutea]|uniref:collagen-like protein n=1 Tax=Croceivirga lutea TaxID=1775167 RepID=UPI00163A113C|nr:collagen-like protein [Croceivirga lutea]
MKDLKILFAAVVSLVLFSCEGPAGPPGPPGFDGVNGQDGVNILGTVLEIQGTFEESNDYSIFYEFPSSVEVFESDAVLVYLLWDQVDDANGGDPIDVWRLLPQTRILDQGLLQYNYDHTFLDVNIFLESDFDLTELLPGDTVDQVFRIVVVPAEFAQDTTIDLTNLDDVMTNLELNINDIQKMPSF